MLSYGSAILQEAPFALLVKVGQGGWVPLVVGGALFASMITWRKGRALLFAVMARNAQRATTYFGLPPNRVEELGMQVEL